MTGYWQASIRDLIQARGEKVVKDDLSEFYCPLNPDVEYFIHEKAIEFSKQGIASTHVVYASYQGKTVMVGYYALANKIVTIRGKILESRGWRSRLNKFGTFIRN